MESYGAPPMSGRSLRARCSRRGSGLRPRCATTGRGVVSAFVSSPTFGGGSVLAHLSLLSGIEVRDQDHYALLMTQQRPTLVSTFRNAGYRAVAVMPGCAKAGRKARSMASMRSTAPVA